MPERVTREERKISLMIEKARDAKEILYQSLMDNNRNPMDDESEAFKLKRPKAENYNYKAESNDGPDTFHAYAGEITKMVKLLKNILPEDYETNPFLDDEKRVKLISQIDGLSTMLSGMAKQIKEAKISEQPAIMDKMVEINQKLAALEKELSEVPEQTKFYDSEYSGETLDPEYERNR
tara:strand:+ start:3761 stop:4297 length:537 start_codon:yes stop_codon:yes gene_type:complete